MQLLLADKTPATYKVIAIWSFQNDWTRHFQSFPQVLPIIHHLPYRAFRNPRCLPRLYCPVLFLADLFIAKDWKKYNRGWDLFLAELCRRSRTEMMICNKPQKHNFRFGHSKPFSQNNQIGRFIDLWATFQSLPKSPTLLGNFCKCVKISFF